MFDWLFPKKPAVYIVDVEFAKFKRCQPVRRKYKTHAGDKISNSYMQMTITVCKPDELLNDATVFVKELFPQSFNHRITSVMKVD